MKMLTLGVVGQTATWVTRSAYLACFQIVGTTLWELRIPQCRPSCRCDVECNKGVECAGPATAIEVIHFSPRAL